MMSESSYTQLLNADAFCHAVFMVDTVQFSCLVAKRVMLCYMWLYVLVCPVLDKYIAYMYKFVLTVHICLSREVVMYCILVFVFTFCIDCT